MCACSSQPGTNAKRIPKRKQVYPRKLNRSLTHLSLSRYLQLVRHVQPGKRSGAGGKQLARGRLRDGASPRSQYRCNFDQARTRKNRRSCATSCTSTLKNARPCDRRAEPSVLGGLFKKRLEQVSLNGAPDGRSSSKYRMVKMRIFGCLGRTRML